MRRMAYWHRGCRRGCSGSRSRGGRRRALRLFRDESSLSANPHLWSSITEALDQSGWFVLLLSPEAADSTWVGQEIEYWVANRDPARILPVVTDGAFGWSDGDVVGDAVPDTLRGVFSEEPRWVDLRWAKDEDQLDLQDPRFADAVADIGSAIRGIPKDELASEEVRQHRRTVRTAWAGGVALAALAALAGVLAVQSSNNAERAASEAVRANEQAELATSEADRANEAADRAEESATAEAGARSIAEGNARLASARELAASAIGVVEEDPRLATWLALAAIDQTPDGQNQPVEVINALWRAAAADPLESIIDTGYGGNTHVGLSPDGRNVAISSAEGAELQVRDAVTHEIAWVYSEETEDGFMRPVFSPDGSMVAIDVIGSESEDSPRQGGVDDSPNRVVILEAATGVVVEVLEFPDCESVWSPAWSPDGSQMAVSVGSPPRLYPRWHCGPYLDRGVRHGNVGIGRGHQPRGRRYCGPSPLSVR